MVMTCTHVMVTESKQIFLSIHMRKSEGLVVLFKYWVHYYYCLLALNAWVAIERKIFREIDRIFTWIAIRKTVIMKVILLLSLSSKDS